MANPKFKKELGHNLYEAELDGRSVAIRLEPVEDGFSETMLSELSIMTRLSPQRNIVPVTRVFGYSQGSAVAVVMPLANQNLATLLKTVWKGLGRGEAPTNPPDIDVLLGIAQDVLCGLHQMHSNGTVHLRINPNNILLFPAGAPGGPSALVAKLSDFGDALRLRADAKVSYPRGSPGYRAPELACNDSTRTYMESYAPAADMFSLGCLLLDIFFNAQGAFVQGSESELVLLAQRTGVPNKDDPFWKLDSDGHCFRELEGLQKRKASNEKAWLKVYGTKAFTALTDIIDACLSWNPKDRPSASKVLKGYPTLFDKACNTTSTKSPFAQGSKLLPEGMFAWHVLEKEAKYPSVEAIHSSLDLAGHIYKRFVDAHVGKRFAEVQDPDEREAKGLDAQVFDIDIDAFTCVLIALKILMPRDAYAESDRKAHMTAQDQVKEHILELMQANASFKKLTVGYIEEEICASLDFNFEGHFSYRASSYRASQKAQRASSRRKQGFSLR